MKIIRRNTSELWKEVIERGDAELVKDGGSKEEMWYIPHHGVRYAKKPDTFCVAFDCSARYRETGQNNHLLRGPDMLNNLTGVLIHFRRLPKSLVSDIEKMFHQFHVAETDHNYLCFL